MISSITTLLFALGLSAAAAVQPRQATTSVSSTSTTTSAAATTTYTDIGCYAGLESCLVAPGANTTCQGFYTQCISLCEADYEICADYQGDTSVYCSNAAGLCEGVFPHSFLYTSAPVTTTTITPSSTPTSTATSSASETTTSISNRTASSSPANLNGTYQFPHLIVPISSLYATTAYGTQYFGYINSTTSTIFNFDIPSSYAGETCTLVFLMSEVSSDYTLDAAGNVTVSQLSGPATQATTYDTAPAPEADLGMFDGFVAGSRTVLATGACAAGETVSYELGGTGEYDLSYFQDYSSPPIGLYVVQC